AGLLCVYVGGDRKNAVGAVNAVIAEMQNLCDQALEQEELDRAKEFTKGRLRLELESTNGVSFWLAYQQLLMGSIKTIDDEIALVDAVTAADVRRVAIDVLRAPIQMAVIGPFAKDAAFRAAVGA